MPILTTLPLAIAVARTRRCQDDKNLQTLTSAAQELAAVAEKTLGLIQIESGMSAKSRWPLCAGLKRGETGSNPFAKFPC